MIITVALPILKQYWPLREPRVTLLSRNVMSKMFSSHTRFLCVFCLGLTVLFHLGQSVVLGQETTGQKFGDLQADRILFLGNSLTLHGPKPEIEWFGNWGMAASAQDKDYVHLLTAAIDARTKGKLLLEPTPVTGNEGVENILNIANIVERGYATYEVSKIKKQLGWKAGIVVVQCGENVPPKDFDPKAFDNAFKTLLDDLDEIKRRVCAQDPAHRTFVDITDYAKDISANGPVGHPNDKGMKLIADTLFVVIAKKSGVHRGALSPSAEQADAPQR
jgi:hypothetical protein